MHEVLPINIYIYIFFMMNSFLVTVLKKINKLLLVYNYESFLKKERSMIALALGKSFK